MKAAIAADNYRRRPFVVCDCEIFADPRLKLYIETTQGFRREFARLAGLGCWRGGGRELGQVVASPEMPHNKLMHFLVMVFGRSG